MKTKLIFPLKFYVDLNKTFILSQLKTFRLLEKNIYCLCVYMPEIFYRFISDACVSRLILYIPLCIFLYSLNSVSWPSLSLTQYSCIKHCQSPNMYFFMFYLGKLLTQTKADRIMQYSRCFSIIIFMEFQ